MTRVRILALLFVGVSILIGIGDACKRHATYKKDDSNKAKVIKLEKKLTVNHSYFGDIEGNLLNDPDIPTIAIDKNKNIYVADQGYNNIKVFSESGNLIDTLGRKGKGPGEFERIANLQIREDTLFAYDANLFRLSLYSTKGNFRFINDIPLKKPALRHIWISLSGDFIGEFVTYYSSKNLHAKHNVTIKKISQHEGVTDTNLFNLPGDQMVVHQISLEGEFSVDRIPFGSQPVIQLYKNSIYYGETNKPVIQIFSLIHKSTTNVSLKISPIPIPEQAMDTLISLYPRDDRAILRNAELPKNYPLYNNFVVDNHHNVWICTNSKNKNQYKWLIVNSKGNVLYTTYLNEMVNLKIINNDDVYGIKTDKDGFKSVVVYHINFLNHE